MPFFEGGIETHSHEMLPVKEAGEKPHQKSTQIRKITEIETGKYIGYLPIRICKPGGSIKDRKR